MGSGLYQQIRLLAGRASADSFWDIFWVLPILLSFIPMLFSLIGTRLGFHQAAGVMGRLGLMLSVAGCAVMIVFVPTSIFGRGGTRGRTGFLGRRHHGELSLEHHDRVHALQRRYPALQVVAALEPAALVLGFNPRLRNRARVTWCVWLPSIATYFRKR